MSQELAREPHFRFTKHACDAESKGAEPSSLFEWTFNNTANPASNTTGQMQKYIHKIT